MSQFNSKHRDEPERIRHSLDPEIDSRISQSGDDGSLLGLGGGTLSNGKLSQFGIFGATMREPPEMTIARTVLDLPRNATPEEMKKKYRDLSMVWHPDKHTGKATQDEADQRMKLYSTSYKLLTDPDHQEKANGLFLQALQEPFVVGKRIFCLGQLYGIRIYLPDGYTQRVTDTTKMLGSSNSSNSAAPAPRVQAAEQRPFQLFGSRQSIFATQLDDAMETHYRGKPQGKENKAKAQTAFENRHQGGLDDLEWIKKNDLALSHFLRREFDKSVILLKEVQKQIHGNVIFKFRLGVCLEAYAASIEPTQGRSADWQRSMSQALESYERCLELATERGQRREVITIMMQLADAYACMGIAYQPKAQALWAEIRSIDPNSVEAQARTIVQARKLLESGKSLASKVFGLLPGLGKS